MAVKCGKCTNIGNCPVSDSGEIVRIEGGEDFVCPDPGCRRGLMEVPCGDTGGPGGKDKKKLIIAGMAALVILIGVGIGIFIWGIGGVTPERDDGGDESPPAGGATAQEIVKKLQTGEFAEAKRLLADADEDEDGIEALQKRVNARVSPELRFEYQQDGGTVSEISIESSRIIPPLLNHEDSYRLLLENDSQEPLYVYVIQKDGKGSLDLIFPNSRFNADDNPLNPGRSFQMPSGRGDWFSPDELPDSAAGPVLETIMVAASPWKAADIEDLYKQIQRAEEGGDDRFLDPLGQRMEARDRADLPAIFFLEFSFMHSR